MLRLSGLFDLGENEQILTSQMKIVSGIRTEIPPLIIGDVASLFTAEVACQTVSK